MYKSNLVLISVALAISGCHPIHTSDPRTAKFPTTDKAWDYSDDAKAEARNGDMEAAKKDIEEAIKLDPSEPDFHNTLAAILIDTNPQGARNELQLTIRLSGKSALNNSDRQQAGAYVNLSMLEIKLKDLKAAEKDAVSATKLAPEDAHAWNNLGVALLKEKKFDAAVAALKKALDLAPDNEHAQRNYQDALHHDVGT
ncbi:MAG TPA: tetratricopeptide repeat protein [Fimbriimonadaceae bacterium]|jgi:superkiller protein 3